MNTEFSASADRTGGEQGLAERLVASATRLGARVAVAESLTGGLVAATIVSVPGASAMFSGGIVAYDTALKASLLGVDSSLLARRGPVDGEVAKQMAAGVRSACAVAGVDADFGVATTGVAGPAPDPQTGQPAGTVWIGVSSEAGTRSVLVSPVPGSRMEIRERAVRAALAELLIDVMQCADHS